jgi:Transglycosylase SLT domain
MIMTILLFTWYLLTYPADKLICSLWVSQPPSQNAIVQSCGSADLSFYRMDVVPLDNLDIQCSKPANAIYQILDACHLSESLDHYRLRIIQPDYVGLICAIIIQHQGEPTQKEIGMQCPNAPQGQLQFEKSEPLPVAAPPICKPAAIQSGPGLYKQASLSSELTTNDDLTWLAGRMIWFGMVHADCGGDAILDPDTQAATPCGIAAANSLMITWENQFNDDIYNSAISFFVPARLLKRMIEIESQFWPLWISSNGEVGLMQITDNGADVFLRFDPNYNSGYPSEKGKAQTKTRNSFMNSLQCYFCSLDQAVRKAHQTIPIYARILAAYRCRAVSMNSALDGDDAWRQAVVDFNGSIDYLRKVEQ